MYLPVLHIAATDNGMIYNQEKYHALINDENVDAIIFTFRHHVSSKNNPQMYGWVKVDDKENAIDVSVKIPISDNPFEDHAIVGTFWFKRVEYFNKALKNLLNKNRVGFCQRGRIEGYSGDWECQSSNKKFRIKAFGHF